MISSSYNFLAGETKTRIIYIYIIYIRLKSVRITFLSCQMFVLPTMGFQLTPLMHCSTNRLALSHTP